MGKGLNFIHNIEYFCRVIAKALLVVAFISCSGNLIQHHNINSDSNHELDTSIQVYGFSIHIQRPKVKEQGTLLLLPGWNYSNTFWCDSSSVCDSALSKGLVVIAPQMARSIYASHYYAETRKDMRAFPTLNWLDSALDFLKREYHFFEGKNYVLGLSTGGRGVALICERKPGFFHAAAALSGDFDQAVMPEDRLTTVVYGPYSSFSKRWKTDDNPVHDRNKMITPIYLGHGLKDKVVPLSQTREFFDSLAALPDYRPAGSVSTRQDVYPKLTLHLDPLGGHNFAYWRSELPAIWRFFEQY